MHAWTSVNTVVLTEMNRLMFVEIKSLSKFKATCDTAFQNIATSYGERYVVLKNLYIL